MINHSMDCFLREQLQEAQKNDGEKPWVSGEDFSFNRVTYQWPKENLIEVYHCDRSGQALTLREKHPTWLMIKSLNIQNLTMTTYEHLGYIADEWWLVDDYFGVLTMNIWGY